MSSQPDEKNRGNTFEDADLRMRIPSDLKGRRRRRYFERSPEQWSLPGLLFVAIDILSNSESFDSVKEALLTAPSGDWLGVQQRVIRRGAPAFVPQGLEILASSFNTVNGDLFYDYDVLFPMKGRYVYALFFGRGGDIEDFERACKEIILSIELKQRATDSPASPPARAAPVSYGDRLMSDMFECILVRTRPPAPENLMPLLKAKRKIGLKRLAEGLYGFFIDEDRHVPFDYEDDIRLGNILSRYAGESLVALFDSRMGLKRACLCEGGVVTKEIWSGKRSMDS
jgi:hypothetical protein